ncbi:LysR family transcriptional regulator [Aliiroseovarius crassostreae]|uniref:LysR family transcriptional regulator n=1 Tax=Aliiroseovarius crassostreae TaxID=154981 RepID=UPI0022059176|nr:LysR family transcriptional regulator [Aliiroseovarius crassostreae]UWP88064.1 LysR family transcriptional regulator [Aliiroseovarius crassostreae]
MVETVGKITFWGVEVFVAIADERAISAAARRLGASPSAVSQQLSNLELSLGTELFNRSARPLTLTPAGELFLKRAQAILNEAEQARAELAQSELASLMRLRLGVIEDLDAEVTPLLLTQLSQQLGTTQFLLETGASHRLYEQLEARALDVIVAADIGAAAHWMEIHPVLQDPFVAVVPRGYLRGKDSAELLSGLPLVRYSARHYMGRQISDYIARHHLRMECRFELDSYHAIMAMVAKGGAWSVLTPLAYLHAQQFREDVELVPLPFGALKRQISLVARRDVLGGLPLDIAQSLQSILSQTVLEPALAEMPWLQKDLRLL